MSRPTTQSEIFSGNPFLIDEVTPTHELGELMSMPDGRSFRYVKNGAAALVIGNLLQGPAEVTGNQSRIVAAAVVGAYTITTTDTVTVTADQYAGGWVLVTGEAGTGRGEMYQIKSHPAATAAVVTLTLEEPVTTALSAASQIDLVQNPYNGVLQFIATPTSTAVGVAVNNITAAYYGWIQVGGVAAVLADGGLTVGNTVVGSNGTAGAVEAAANASTEAQPVVGIAVTGVATTECGAVKLLLN